MVADAQVIGSAEISNCRFLHFGRRGDLRSK
jgi:hypothetical protein